MAVMRFDPFRDFDRLTEQFFGGARGLRGIPMEAYQRGDHFLIHLDLPGVSPDAVDLTLERNVLSIRAERQSPRQEGDEVLVDERPQGAFTRQLFLGDNLDADRLNASYDLGVLTITIPVAEQAKPRPRPDHRPAEPAAAGGAIQQWGSAMTEQPGGWRAHRSQPIVGQARRAVASFPSYQAAEEAVDVLSDQGFPVQRVAIVGRDLHTVEQSTGRMGYAKAALRGAVQGALLGCCSGGCSASSTGSTPLVTGVSL